MIKNTYLKKLLSHSCDYWVGQIVVMAAGFLSLPILTRLFPVGDYGILGLVTTTIFLISAIAKFGSQYSTVRYYEEYNNKGGIGLSNFYATFFYQSLFFSLGAALFFFFIVKAFPFVFERDFRNIIYEITFLIVTSSIIIRFKNFVRVEQHTKKYSILSILQRYGRLLMGFFAIYLFGIKLSIFLIGQIIVDVLLVIYFLIYFYDKNVFNIRMVSSILFKESILYGFPLLLLEISTLLFKFIDRYIIQAFLNPESLGIYTLGANISNYLQDLLFLPISLALFPLYMEIWNKKGKEDVEIFLSKITHVLLCICIPICFGGFLLSKELVILLASSKFVGASNIIPLILIGSLCWGFYHIFAAGLYIFKKTKLLAGIIFLSCVLDVILNIILLPRIGILGSAISILISYISMSCLTLIVSFKYIKVKIDFVVIGKYVVFSFITFLLLKIIIINQPFYSLTIKFIFGSVIYFIFLNIFDRNINRKFKYIFSYFSEFINKVN